MLTRVAAVLLTCSTLIVAGCSSNSDTGTNAVGPTANGTDGDSGDDVGGENNADVSSEANTDDTDEGDGADTAAEDGGLYRFTFTNLTTSQPLTAPIVAIHDEGTHLFETGADASVALRVLAENGDSDAMIDLLDTDITVSATGIAPVDPAVAVPGPIPPGGNSSLVLETTAADQVFSAVSMIVCTNDGFSGGDSLPLPTGDESLSFDQIPYDAGSEVNTIDVDFWVAPCGSEINEHEAESATIGPHPGQTGITVGGTDIYGFEGTEPVLRIDVERVESTVGTYDIEFTNLSTSQIMSPPLAVIHAPSVSLFSVGEFASPQLQQIAENGENEDLLTLVSALDGVSDITNADTPIQPGGTTMLTLESTEVADVFSSVNMIVCTNDGFSGADSIRLPSSTETATFEFLPYDAGTEVNTLDLEWWVMLCGGTGANMHEDEGGLIAAHPGQAELDGFEVVAGEEILRISITRQSEATDVDETADEGNVSVDTGGEETGGSTASENAGAAESALVSAGVYTSFIAAFSPQSYDDEENDWTVFAATDDTIAAGTFEIQNHIVTTGSSTPAQLLEAGSITVANSRNTYPVTGTEEALLIGGYPVSLLVEGETGTMVYVIEGLLQ